MQIREYKKTDEQSWIRCRVLSFLDSSYFDDVQNYREDYDHPAVKMVAVDSDNTVIGFLDCEYEQAAGDFCYFNGPKGGVIWHLGVLPEYRKQGVASSLWEAAKEKLKKEGIQRVEVWTQDDEQATQWYVKQGFEYKEAYLNAYIKGTTQDSIIQKYINLDNLGEIYGVRNFNFEAPLSRKAELEKICYRLHEVRVYELYL